MIWLSWGLATSFRNHSLCEFPKEVTLNMIIILHLVINGFVFDTAIRSRWGGLQVEYFRYSTEVAPDVPLGNKVSGQCSFP